jgi:hypothetical protein
MATFSIIMEMVPGEAGSRMVEPIEADNIDNAWELARARWYNSPLEEQNRKIITRAGTQLSVTPQIVDIKAGEYTLPEVVQAPLDLEPAAEVPESVQTAKNPAPPVEEAQVPVQEEPTPAA